MKNKQSKYDNNDYFNNSILPISRGNLLLDIDKIGGKIKYGNLKNINQ
jgi:hypothetical protein